MSEEQDTRTMDIGKKAEEIKKLIELRGEAPNQWCWEHAQSLINNRKLDVIEHCEQLLKDIRGTCVPLEERDE